MFLKVQWNFNLVSFSSLIFSPKSCLREKKLQPFQGYRNLHFRARTKLSLKVHGSEVTQTSYEHRRNQSIYSNIKQHIQGIDRKWRWLRSLNLHVYTFGDKIASAENKTANEVKSRGNERTSMLCSCARYQAMRWWHLVVIAHVRVAYKATAAPTDADKQSACPDLALSEVWPRAGSTRCAHYPFDPLHHKMQL